MIQSRLAALMTERGETATAVMRSTGVAYNTVWRLAHGQTVRIDFETLDRLCRHFQVSPGEILEWTPNGRG